MLDYAKQCATPLAIILFAFATAYFLFKNNEFPNYSGYYQKIGIGFIQISSTSFYWYILAMLSTVVILLFKLRNRVSSTYLVSGFLLTYCAIGNSIYFFGRSHEHNILNISIVLLLLCFFMLDLISQSLNEGLVSKGSVSLYRRYATLCAASVILVAIMVYYSDNIEEKTTIQIAQGAKGQMIFPLEPDQSVYPVFLNRVKALTNNSSKVYFVGGPDFEFYYYGGYAPVGYCNPFTTWIFTKDLNRFLQGLLDDGYYLVCSAKMKFMLSNLHYNDATELGHTVVVAKLPQRVLQP